METSIFPQNFKKAHVSSCKLKKAHVSKNELKNYMPVSVGTASHSPSCSSFWNLPSDLDHAGFAPRLNRAHR